MPFILPRYKGELLALQWQDVNLKDGVIKVKRSLDRVNASDEKSKTKTILIFHEPKTQSGNRSIPLPKSIIKQLKIHKSKQAQEKLDSKGLYADNDLMFCTELGKPLELGILLVNSIS